MNRNTNISNVIDGNAKKSQYETEFADGNYDDIKKVYSVWVCMNTPRKVENTITRYCMMKEDVHGHVEDTARYDLLEVVMVCLGKFLTLRDLVSDGILTNEQAATRMNISVEHFVELCNLAAII